MVPKRPWLSPSGPAVKKSLSVGVVVRSLTELERPQAVDGQNLAFARPELADELERPVQLRLERADLPVAEVPDEQVAAEAAEAGRRHRKAPWRVQLAVRRDAGEQCATRVELVYEAQALAGDVILPVGVLLRVGDEDVP